MGFHHNVRQHHFITGLGNAISKFEIVGQIIDQRAQTADGVKRAARHCQRGAKSKMNAAFNLARHQHSSNKIRADANGFQL